MPRQRPLFLVPGTTTAVDAAADDTGSTDTGPMTTTDWRHHTDEQLLEERERRLRAVEEPLLRIEPLPGSDRRGATADDTVDRITDELLRRARQRHPSARGRAG